MGACKCNDSFRNTGFGCSPLMEKSEKLVIVPQFGFDGSTENFIDLDDAITTQAFWTDLINELNPEDRYFPLPLHKNPSSERGDSVFESFDDETRQFITEGRRTNSIMISGKAATPGLYAKLKAFRCSKFGVLFIDKNRSLIGSSHGEVGKIYPIIIDADTWDVKYVWPTAKTKPHILINFDWAITEVDDETIILSGEELAPANILKLEGLTDVTSTYSAITTTGFKAVLKTDQGPITNLIPVRGLVSADFALYNVTDSAAVVITSVTENPDGTYTFVIPAQTSADVLRLTPTKNGFDFSEVVESTILIP